MENYIKPVLSEEQMAAYLDGMLSAEENEMVEELIYLNPEMEEIQESIDSIDSTYIYEVDNEVPIECMADDFSLPQIGLGFDHIGDGVYDANNYNMGEYEIAENTHDGYDDLDDQDDYHDTDAQDDFCDMDVQDDDVSDVGNEESFSDDEYGDFVF